MIAVILDPAHGKNTPGKRSPDGRHREYLWSRERIRKIIHNINRENPRFNIYSPFLSYENEPGLTNRVIKYNDISKSHDFTFVLPIHNDAYGKKWSKPKGTSVWTSRGETGADKYATSLFNFLKVHYPNDKFRAACWLSEKEKISDPDWEKDFTILAGNDNVKPSYEAVLLEWRFQTNKEDVECLLKPKHNEYFEDMITLWLMSTFNNEINL
jgi:N-acetylmuramoyl-L-alanine amidase